MKFIRRTVATVLLICIAALLCLADHLPDNLVIRGIPEHKLCGIDVYQTHVPQIEAVYGRPTSFSDSPETGADVLGRDYVWQKNDLKLQASVYRHKDGTETEAYVVDVWGSRADGKLGRTGQGIRLGCTIECIHEKYGRRYRITRGTPAAPASLLLEWKDGTHLSIDFDAHGRVDHLQLFAEIE